jgi:LmbE family N-acetylglucosaminyl deacetylase
VGVSQVRPVNDYGALGLGQLLRKLQTTGSVMMIGAHPDDEDSALLAYLARGENARTAYLSLTRGDGGQNIIGPELFEPLGVIRTEELLQARRLDGAEQYFTRAFDYGFSKTLDEAKSKWPEEVIKCDAVRAIRLFRPLVVISRFTGTPQDGHGQHQYAGYITPLAVKAAADPQQCKDAGEAWTVKKFYIETGFQDNSEPTLKINTGQYDPILGRTYFEIAMEGRSQGRSQGEGRIEFHGDQFSGLNLAGGANEVRETGIFDGIDVTLGGIENTFRHHNRRPPPADLYRSLGATVEQLNAGLGVSPRMLDILLDAYRQLSNLLEYDPATQVSPAGEKLMVDYDIDPVLFEKRRQLEAAIERAVNLRIDALADSETVVPGSDLMVSVKVFQPGRSSVRIGDIALGVPYKWTAIKIEPPKQPNSAYNSREVATAGAVFNVKADSSSDLTQPYWLSSSRDGDLLSWPRAWFRGLPFAPQQLEAVVKLKVSGYDISLDQPVQYRFADPARGEIRRNVDVVPGLSVAVDRDLLVVPVSDRPQTRRLVVSVTNNTSKERSGHVSLNIAVSPEWKVEVPQGSLFSLKTRGAKASIPFDITIPPGISAGTVAIRASAEVGMDPPASLTMNVVAYPHIQTHRYYTPADATIRVLDLKTVPLNVGYVMGSGDEVPEAIRQMGMKVTMLEESDLASGDLSKFDTIVVGIRASETRPDLVANNARLLDYAKAGGNVVVLYQRFNWTGLAPFPVNTQDKQGTTAGSIARVVDENAKVTILDPQNPVFNFPNKITDADFGGWVQERNAYNLVTFDPQYTPLLESHDAGEQENKGGLVVAKVGKGTWVYCSYSFFRQLPAGVPGAYRLFDNLLSLPKAR